MKDSTCSPQNFPRSQPNVKQTSELQTLNILTSLPSDHRDLCCLREETNAPLIELDNKWEGVKSTVASLHKKAEHLKSHLSSALDPHGAFVLQNPNLTSSKEVSQPVVSKCDSTQQKAPLQDLHMMLDGRAAKTSPAHPTQGGGLLELTDAELGTLFTQIRPKDTHFNYPKSIHQLAPPQQNPTQLGNMQHPSTSTSVSTSVTPVSSDHPGNSSVELQDAQESNNPHGDVPSLMKLVTIVIPSTHMDVSTLIADLWGQPIEPLRPAPPPTSVPTDFSLTTNQILRDLLTQPDISEEAVSKKALDNFGALAWENQLQLLQKMEVETEYNVLDRPDSDHLPICLQIPMVIPQLPPSPADWAERTMVMGKRLKWSPLVDLIIREQLSKPHLLNAHRGIQKVQQNTKDTINMAPAEIQLESVALEATTSNKEC
ncbi:hypothetical protein JRQ81_015155 [Phrynocephalus forsythii]|uniref:Uncharacterized protein n=1 Tax=Phrynocephalus forsythii TaxID=171643 RepID=A0A9Q0XZ08_9SAUR|nr:hypothetical protein JRQ81_015155 [Phrynocephalus forsythii]